MLVRVALVHRRVQVLTMYLSITIAQMPILLETMRSCQMREPAEPSWEPPVQASQEGLVERVQYLAQLPLMERLEERPRRPCSMLRPCASKADGMRQLTIPMSASQQLLETATRMRSR